MVGRVACRLHCSLFHNVVDTPETADNQALKFLPKPKPVTAIDSSISNGAELAGVVLVFFLIGLGIDVWAGTTPWFMIALTVFGTVGQFVKMYFTYSARMRTLEQARADAVRSAGR